jgi:hypothetical protein
MLEMLDEWKFLAGLGIFLFGMFMMEESIKLLSGRSFKTLIRRYTGSRLKGLTTGIVSTSILQSSSAVSLMVLAFVGAGLMTLANAIAVIIGAKVGTTDHCVDRGGFWFQIQNRSICPAHDRHRRVGADFFGQISSLCEHQQIDRGLRISFPRP